MHDSEQWLIDISSKVSDLQPPPNIYQRMNDGQLLALNQGE